MGKQYYMSVNKLVVILFIFLFAEYNLAVGGQYQWNGSVDTAWNNAGNWSPNTVPGIDDTALFNSTSASCAISSDISIKSIVLNSGYTGQFTFGSRRVTVSGDVDFSSGGTFFITTFDTLVLNSNTLQRIIGKQGEYLPFIIKDGTGTLEVNNTGFKTMGFSLRNGNLSNLSAFNDTINGDFICTGGRIDLNNGSLTINGNAEFNGVQNFVDTTGIIYFNGVVNQIIKNSSSVRFPAIEKLSTYDLVIENSHFCARSLAIMYGQVRMDTSFRIDTIQFFPGATLMSDTSSTGHDTINYVNGNGYWDIGNSELCFNGNNLDLSSISSFTTGYNSSLTFIGNNQSFVPPSYSLITKVRQRGTGITTVLTNGLHVDTLELVSGEFNLGNGLSDSINGAVKMLGGTLNFSSCTLSVGTNIDLNGPGTIIPGSGMLKFNGYMDHVFVPRTGGNNPAIGIYSMTTHVVGNHLKAGRVDIYGGILEMDTSFNIDTLNLGAGTTLRSDSATGNSDTVRYITGNGYLELRNSELCFDGNQVDLNAAGSISGGSLAFIGSNQTFTPSTYFMYSKICRKGAGVTTVTTNGLRVDTLELISGEFNLGNGLIDSLGTALKMMGGILNFGSSVLRTGAAVLDLNGTGTITPGNGKIEFISTGNQDFIPPVAVVLPAVHSSSNQLHIKQNRLRTSSLQINSGMVILDTTISIDTLNISNGTTLMFDTTGNQRDTIGYLNGAGVLTFGKTTIYIKGDANFGNFNSFSGYADLEFGSLQNRTFIPNSNFIFNKIKKVGSGTLTVDSQGLRVNFLAVLQGNLSWGATANDTIYDTLYVKNATMNLGSNSVAFRSLVDSNAVLNFDYGNLVRCGSSGTVDLSTASGLNTNYGGINFEGLSGATVNLIPSPVLRLPPIHVNGNDTVKVSGNLTGTAIFQNSGGWDWGNNFSHTVHTASVYGGVVAFGNSTVAIDSGDFSLESVSDVSSGAATIHFNASTGTQSIIPPLTSSITLPQIFKSDTSTLQIVNHELRCRTFRQTAGKIGFSGYGIIADTQIVIENVDSLLNLGGVTLQAGQSIQLSGNSSTMINCNASTQWYINVTGSLRAENAIIGNCVVTGTNGIVYPPYIDAGGNSNWVFWVDTFPPDNDLVLNLQSLDTGRVRIWWNPGSIDSSDAEFVGIRYSSSKMPDSMNDGSTILLGTYSLIDSVDTVIDLNAHTTYYFAAAVSDTSGNWADFTTNSRKTIRTRAVAPYSVLAPDTVHKQSFVISWVNPPGLSTIDSVYIHTVLSGNSNWSLSSTIPSSLTTATVALPASEGTYQFMISTSHDSAGIYYSDDVFIGSVTYSVTPPIIVLPNDTFFNYTPLISWQAPAGFGSPDSFFVFSDTITGKSNWILKGQYASNIVSHTFAFSDFGKYKVMVSTSWDKYGAIEQNNIAIDTIILVPSSKMFTWDISSDSGYQVSNGTWGSDRFWSNDGKSLTAWPGAGYTACFSALTSNTIIGLNGIQYADSIVFNASGYTLSGDTLILSTGILRGMALDTIKSDLNSKTLAKTGSGEIVITGKTQCDSINAFEGVLTMNRSDTDTVIVPGVLSVYSNVNGYGRLAQKVNIYSKSTFTPGVALAKNVSMDELYMSPGCTLNIDIGTQYDTLSVKNTAILNGYINISSLKGFGKGAYPIITCAGTMIDSGIKIAKTPFSTYTYNLSKETGGLVIYVDTLLMDTAPPKIKINVTSGAIFQQMPSVISGNAYDSISGLLSVSILVNKINDSTYWNGVSWQNGIFWLQIQPQNQWNFVPSGVSSSDGRYIIKAGATDSAGNVAYDTTDFLIDGTAPVITTMFDNIDSIGSWNGLISGEAYDSLTRIKQVSVSVKNDSGKYFDGSTWIPTETYLISNGTNQWSYQVDINTLLEGKYNVAVIVSDTIGNSSITPYLKVFNYFLKKDTVPVTSTYKAGLHTVAVNCSTATFSWNPKLPDVIDSVQLAIGKSGYPANVTEGEYHYILSKNDSGLTISTLPATGLTLYSKLFLKERAGGYTIVPDSAVSVTLLADCVPPENLVQSVVANTGDSLTVIQLKAGNTDSVQILFGFGESPDIAVKNVKILPGRDTVLSFRTIVPGSFYCAYAVRDPDGNSSLFNYDSIQIKNTPPVLRLLADTIVMERSTLIRTLSAYDINNDSLMYNLVNARAGMTVTGPFFKWIPGGGDIGSHAVVIECKDARGAVTYDTFNIMVKDIPEAPVISYSGNTDVFEDSSYEGVINVTDPDIADTPKVSIVKLPAWLKLSENKLTGVPKNEDVGISAVELIYTDLSSLSDTLELQIRVINTNDKPVVLSSSIADTVIEKQKYTFDIKINDVDANDSISVKSPNARSWLKISSVNKSDNGKDWIAQIQCTPVQADTGVYEIKFEIADRSNSIVNLNKKMYVLDSDDPPSKPVLTRKVVNGAAQIMVTAVDDRDAQLLYSVKIRALKSDSTVFKDSSISMSHMIFPLTDGRYEVKAIAIDGGGLKSAEVTDTFPVTGASDYVFKDTGWSMVSIPSKIYLVSNLINSRYLLNWDESGVEKQVYSYYKKKEELTEIEGAKAYWRKGYLNDTIHLSSETFEKGLVNVSLHKTVSGWNQISSPYPYPVAWPRKSDVVWRWNSKNNDYEEVQNVLEPWNGYWVRVDTAASVILSPVPVFSTGTLAKLRKCYYQSKDNWSLQVSIRAEGGCDVDNKFGFNQHAMDRYDEMDRPEPPEFEGRPVLYFNHEDWGTSCKEFASDIRKTWKSLNIFEFAISGSKDNEEGVLSFVGMDNTRNLYVFTKIGDSLVQIEGDVNYIVQLSKSKSYQTVFVTDNPRFLSTFPLHFKMGNPYPNPFCPSTRINYTIPYRWSKDGKINLNPYNVSIDIYDIMGRKLKSVVYRKMTPGNYTVMWNGKAESGRIVASGKYFCVLKADELKQVRNLTLIK